MAEGPSYMREGRNYEGHHIHGRNKHRCLCCMSLQMTARLSTAFEPNMLRPNCVRRLFSALPPLTQWCCVVFCQLCCALSVLSVFCLFVNWFKNITCQCRIRLKPLGRQRWLHVGPGPLKKAKKQTKNTCCTDVHKCP